MTSAAKPVSQPYVSLDLLDRAAIAYLLLPLVIFLIGWLRLWAALPLMLCVFYALRPLADARPASRTELPITPLQLIIAVIVGCAWTLFGGFGHLFFANQDLYIRDAVLHDLIVSQWPVGYGVLDGKESVLRAPVGFYLPAAVVGKWAGVQAAHFTMAVWTAAGATLFLLQALSLTPSRITSSLTTVAVVVLFSGFDILGNLLDRGERFVVYWDITSHLEWWAGLYQYSSMTTQLFWCPNHAFGGWLMIGLLYRSDRRNTPLDFMLPLLMVAIALWSPLAALGVAPYVLWKAVATMNHERSMQLLHPSVWAPALLVGIVVAAYLTLDSGRIPKGWTWWVGRFPTPITNVFRQIQFFLLEAGLIGIAILAIRRSYRVVMALAILAILPTVYFGAANDLVMRASIPSLAVLTIASCMALSQSRLTSADTRKKVVLACLLAIGAVTPIQEFARAFILKAWPINSQATLIGTTCGEFPSHYVARMGDQLIGRALRTPHALALPSAAEIKRECSNPAVRIMWDRGLR
jgi:hypothetical protein